MATKPNTQSTVSQLPLANKDPLDDAAFVEVLADINTRIADTTTSELIRFALTEARSKVVKKRINKLVVEVKALRTYLPKKTTKPKATEVPAAA